MGGGGVGSIGDFEGVNSPLAISMEARPCGLVGENQPPGKKREEVVDSSLVRPVAGEGTSSVTVSPALLSSSVRRKETGL